MIIAKDTRWVIHTLNICVSYTETFIYWLRTVMIINYESL